MASKLLSKFTSKNADDESEDTFGLVWVKSSGLKKVTNAINVINIDAMGEGEKGRFAYFARRKDAIGYVRNDQPRMTGANMIRKNLTAKVNRELYKVLTNPKNIPLKWMPMVNDDPPPNTVYERGYALCRMAMSKSESLTNDKTFSPGTLRENDEASGKNRKGKISCFCQIDEKGNVWDSQGKAWNPIEVLTIVVEPLEPESRFQKIKKLLK